MDSRFLGFLQLKNMYRFRVAGTTKEHWIHTKSKTTYRDASFHPSAKFKQFSAIINLKITTLLKIFVNFFEIWKQFSFANPILGTYVKDPDDSALLRRGCNFRSIRTESKSCQWTIVSWNHCFGLLEKRKRNYHCKINSYCKKCQNWRVKFTRLVASKIWTSPMVFEPG